ncbi:MAG TPA: fatty acid desaturase family protein [Polyangiaceae bacterium]|nr:fatty acid desaturase family protein [Polyangiaceae bacterium]
MSSARQYLSTEQIAELRRLNPLRGVGGIVWTWLWILASFALYIARPSLLTFAIGWIIVSSRHLALAILMHEAAHCLIVRSKRLNDVLGNWLAAYPIMVETSIYRGIHLQHHRATWTDADPDRALATPFPITKQSMVRKVLRDLTGRTGYSRYKMIARLSAGLSPYGQGLEGKALGRALADFAKNQRGFLITNALLLAGLSAAGAPEAFFLLWWLPALTGYSLVLRLRSIAEHAVVSDPNDELRQTRTTLAPFWLRFLIAPHHVNYHLEHHLFMFVPHYRLPRAHRMLRAAGVLANAEVAPSYWHVLKQATSRGA